MEDYLNYVAGIFGAKVMVPIVFSVALLGPCIVYRLVNSTLAGWQNKLKWLIAALTYFSCLMIFIITGGFIGTQLDYPALGMGLGLVIFYYSYNAFTSLLPSTCPIEYKSEHKQRQEKVKE